MPVINVGNIRVTVTFKTSTSYGKTGKFERTEWMYTSYMNTATSKTATAAELQAAGIRNRQAPRVKLTAENADFLFKKVERAGSGELNARHAVNLLGAKTYGLPTEAQELQFQQALLDMFRSTNPTDAEMLEFESIIRNLTPKECQEFFDRYRSTLKPGFTGYHSSWSTVGEDGMPRYTGKNEDEITLRRRLSEDARKKILQAARSFIKLKGKQKQLEEFVKKG